MMTHTIFKLLQIYENLGVIHKCFLMAFFVYISIHIQIYNILIHMYFVLSFNIETISYKTKGVKLKDLIEQ